MVRCFLSFGGWSLAAGMALMACLHWSGGVDLGGLFGARPELDSAFQRGFRSDTMAKVNRLRLSAGVEQLRGDEAIQGFLGEWIGAHSRPRDLELDEVFDALQQRFPGAQYLAANLVTSGSREDLLGKLAGWRAVASPEFDSVNTTVFRAGTGLGALAVMSRRLPEFSLRAANERGGRFHNRCPHCSATHALELDRDSRTLILSCPHCDLPFDVLAVGTGGEMRRAPEFFEGFTLPPGEEAAPGATAAERILALWRRVAAHCEYELDQDRSPGGDHEVWKTSSETWEEAAGDCEDTAILLADLLIGAGFEARVAIGWNGNIGQHAWVVVCAEGRQYLIETTMQKEPEPEDLAEVSALSAFYQPEQLFDRERIYYTTARPDRFGRDYFSEALWKAVPNAAEEDLPRR